MIDVVVVVVVVVTVVILVVVVSIALMGDFVTIRTVRFCYCLWLR